MNCAVQQRISGVRGSRFFSLAVSLILLSSVSACRFGSAHPHSKSAEKSNSIGLQSAVTADSPDELIRKYEQENGIGIPRGAQAVLDNTASLDASNGQHRNAAKIDEAHPLGHKKARHPLKENLTADLLPHKAKKPQKTEESVQQARNSITAKTPQRKTKRPAVSTKNQSAPTAKENTSEDTSSDSDTQGFGLASLAGSLRAGANKLFGSTEADQEQAVDGDSPEKPDDGSPAMEEPAQEKVVATKQDIAAVDKTSPQEKTAETETPVIEQETPVIEQEIDEITVKLVQEAEAAKKAAAAKASAAVEELTIENEIETAAEELNTLEAQDNEQELARARLDSTQNAEENTSLFWEFALLALLVGIFFVALWVRLERDYSE